MTLLTLIHHYAYAVHCTRRDLVASQYASRTRFCFVFLPATLLRLRWLLAHALATSMGQIRTAVIIRLHFLRLITSWQLQDQDRYLNDQVSDTHLHNEALGITSTRHYVDLYQGKER
jgi:hypothetical protein